MAVGTTTVPINFNKGLYMEETIETNLYDKCKIITNCTIEIWTNSVTGEESVGWYKTDESEEFDEQ